MKSSKNNDGSASHEDGHLLLPKEEGLPYPPPLDAREQVAQLGFLREEAAKQARRIRIIGSLALALGMAFLGASLASEMPIWVGLIVSVCTALLGAIAFLVADPNVDFLDHVERANDPIEHVAVSTQVISHRYSFQLVLRTRDGHEFQEHFDVTRAPEKRDRILTALHSVVPVVEDA